MNDNDEVEAVDESSVKDTGESSDRIDDAEIRAIEARGVRSRRIPRIVWAGVVTLILIGSGAYLTVRGSSQISKFDALKAHGARVTATVVRCSGTTGCTVKFFVDGKDRSATIAAGPALPGSPVAVIVDRRDPMNVLAVSQVENPESVFWRLEQAGGDVLIAIGTVIFLVTIWLNTRAVRLVRAGEFTSLPAALDEAGPDQAGSDQGAPGKAVRGEGLPVNSSDFLASPRVPGPDVEGERHV